MSILIFIGFSIPSGFQGLCNPKFLSKLNFADILSELDFGFSFGEKPWCCAFVFFGCYVFVFLTKFHHNVFLFCLSPPFCSCCSRSFLCEAFPKSPVSFYFVLGRSLWRSGNRFYVLIECGVQPIFFLCDQVQVEGFNFHFLFGSGASNLRPTNQKNIFVWPKTGFRI